MKVFIVSVLCGMILMGSEISGNNDMCACAKKRDKNDMTSMIHFLVEENIVCQCELSRLKQKCGPSAVIKKDCKEHYDVGQRINGLYSVSPDGKTTFQVYCDMLNGGWTIIQRRINGSVNFDHGWKEYVAGFGDLMGDHWLGLHYIHLLAKSPRQISFEFMMTKTEKMATAVYEGFQVSNACTNFEMKVSSKALYNKEMSKHITTANGFYFQNGAQFSTNDRDNDMYSGFTCTSSHPGAWWFSNCLHIAQINGDFDKMYIVDDTKFQYVSTSEVKIR